MIESFSPLIFQTIAIAATAILLPKLKITSIFGAIQMVLAISFVNHYLWSSNLFGAVPGDLSARSFVLLISNGVIFYILAKFLPGIEVEGMFTAIISPILFSFFTVLAQHYVPLVDWGHVFDVTLDLIFRLKSYLLGSNEASPYKSNKGNILAY